MRELFVGCDANKRPIHLDFKENPHMHVIGATRTGKSKFLEWMIRELIKGGQGFCLIDPHGFLYEDIVRWCAYHCLDREIILLNPSSGDHVKGFNPFQKTSADLSVQIDNQIQTITRAWGAQNTDQTPSLELGLRYVLETIAQSDQTLIAGEFLIDFFKKHETEYLLSFVTRSLTKSHGTGILQAKNVRQFLNDMQMLSTRNRLTRFLTHQQILRFMGLRENNIDVAEIIDTGKILLVNLQSSDSLSEENSRVFGALLVNEFYRQALRRTRGPLGDPPSPYYLLIDEFQRFVMSDDISDMLDQAGKFGLRLVLAHQRLGQIEKDREDDLIDAVFTNIKNRAIFGGLTREAARYVAENCFVNQLDLMQIKMAIYQTKFWPVYTRDKVYAQTYGRSDGETAISGSGSGQAAMTGASRGLATVQGAQGLDWFGNAGPVLSITDSVVDMTSQAKTSMASSASGTFSGESEAFGEIDIPIFYPVPFEELSSAETWSLEEQIWRMSGALMAQLMRHCFIQMPARNTQPMLVPFVKEPRLFLESVAEYEEHLSQKAGALTKMKADMIIEGEKRKLEQDAQLYAQATEILEPQSFRHPKREAPAKGELAAGSVDPQSFRSAKKNPTFPKK